MLKNVPGIYTYLVVYNDIQDCYEAKILEIDGIISSSKNPVVALQDLIEKVYCLYEQCTHPLDSL